MSPFNFFENRPPPSGPLFHSGPRGTHTSRTIMSSDLLSVLDSATSNASNIGHDIIEGNLLGKPTASGRQIAFQRLKELYGLDPSNQLFRVLQKLHRVDRDAVAQLALLAALARDPLLRATAKPVLGLAPGSELMRDTVRNALTNEVGDRLNPAVLDKVVRNAASSWTQSGHLEGRTFKRRRRIAAKVVSAAFALWLARQAGLAGADLFENGWMTALDLDAKAARGMAERARAARLISLQQIGGDLIEIDVSNLDPATAIVPQSA
jgi:hypothetical protein